MIVNEERNQDTGNVFREEVEHDISFTSGTARLWINGVLFSSRDLSVAELARLRPEGLSDAGALATLLAVHEVVPVAEAAAAVGLTAQDLVDEALAWGVAGQ